jgi:integrase/recombinase XerD
MTQKGKAKVLTIHEFKRVDAVASMQKYGKRNRAILYLSFGIGLRACEIRDLTIGDIFEKNLTFWELKETVTLTKTKGGKAREVYLTNKKLCQVLIEHIQCQNEYIKKNRIPLSFNLPLFLSQKGSFFCSNHIVMIMGKMFKEAGISGAKSHSGRRTYITAKIDEGCDIKSISKLVGHCNISQTIEYHESNPTRLKKISERSIF